MTVSQDHEPRLALQGWRHPLASVDAIAAVVSLLHVATLAPNMASGLQVTGK